MSMLSRCTIGAMASKKASASSPVSARIVAARSGEVERAGGDDDAVPFVRRQRHFAARERDQRMRGERRRDGGGKTVAVDGKRAAGRHLIGVGRTASPASRAGASRRAAGRRHCVRDRRSGRSSSRRARRSRRSYARRSSAAAASRAASPARRFAPVAMRLPSRRGRRRRHARFSSFRETRRPCRPRQHHCLAHDPVRKPVPTFRDHASNENARGGRGRFRTFI